MSEDLGDFEAHAELEVEDDAPAIKVGDVALDLAQGRPVHVIEVLDEDASEWSESNDYDLAGNYGNSRFDTTADDHVFEVVYCSNVKSEPSKTYAFPESRLVRVETEAADDGRQVYDRVVVEVLESLFTQAFSGDGAADMDVLNALSHEAFEEDIVDEAMELAEVDAVVGGDE